MADTDYDVVMVGAGHNGLVAASYLAAEGLKVLVLERLRRVGGAIATEEVFPGFHVPYCAYVCHMLHGKVIDDLELRKHGFEVYPLDAWNFHPFPDGSHLVGWHAPQKLYRELRKLNEHDADAFMEWLPFWDRACGIIYRYMLTDPPTFSQVAHEVRGTADEEVWETMLTVPMRDLVERYYEDPRIRAYFINAQDAGDPSAPGSVLSVAYIRSGVMGKSENRGIPTGRHGQGLRGHGLGRALARRGDPDGRGRAPGPRRERARDGRDPGGRPGDPGRGRGLERGSQADVPEPRQRRRISTRRS